MRLLECDNFVISCIDFRIQSFVSSWMQRTFGQGNYDYAAFGGSVKELAFALKQVELAQRLHNIKHIFLIKHEDCGAYREFENPREQQLADLRKAKEEILRLYPSLTVQMSYVHLDGFFEEIS